MAAPSRTPRSGWIDRGLRALAAGGPDAVRVETLASTLGVTKGGFYWHFSDRKALLDEMLDTWERVLIDQAIETVDGEGGDGRSRLRRLFALTSTAGHFLDVELAIRDWGRRDQSVADRLRRVDDRRTAYMRPLFADFCADELEVEARCLLALSFFVGNHYVATDHGPHKRADVLALAARLLER